MSAQEIIDQITKSQTDSHIEKSGKEEKAKIYGTLLEFLASAFEQIVNELKQDGTVEVKNLPKLQQIEGKVELKGLPAVLLALDQLKPLLQKLDKDIIFPKTQDVVVKNFPEPQDIVIPEMPTCMEMSNIVDYSSKLDEISKKISKLKLDPTINIDNPTPQVSIDLEGVKKGLQSIVEQIKAIPVPEQKPIDLKPVINASKSTTQAIKELTFPVPNFQSSWQHSKDMQSKDLNTNYFYKTVATKKVIDYIEVDGLDGNTYRRTFTYDTDGTTDVINKSAWVMQ